MIMQKKRKELNFRKEKYSDKKINYIILDKEFPKKKQYLAESGSTKRLYA